MAKVTEVRTLRAWDDYTAEQAMDELIRTVYPAPTWSRPGPNWVQNEQTGELVNLWNAAQEFLKKNPRMDAVAVVETGGTVEETIIPQEVVKAAGGDLGKIAASLEKALSESDIFSDLKENFAKAGPMGWLGLGVLGFILVKSLGGERVGR